MPHQLEAPRLAAGRLNGQDHRRTLGATHSLREGATSFHDRETVHFQDAVVGLQTGSFCRRSGKDNQNRDSLLVFKRETQDADADEADATGQFGLGSCDCNG